MIDQLLKRVSTGGSSDKMLTKSEQRQEALQSAFPIAFDTAKEWEPAMEKEKRDYPSIQYWDELDYNYNEAATASSAGKFPKKY